MSKQPLHTVLGASGASGLGVLHALKTRNLAVRGVTRSSTIPDVDIVHADLLQLEATRKAIAGSDYVYLCAALPYFANIWQRDWPRMMQNVITACAEIDAVLIFLDNIYMYGPAPLRVPFDESHPQHPTSGKGKARKETADLLLEAIQAGKVRGVIGRSADFYGPATINSMLYISFLERMLEGKAPQSLFPLDIPHTYANTADNGRALVELALDPGTHGQVWHLPVGEAITVKEATVMFNQLLGTNLKVSAIPGFMKTILGWFIPALREVKEMSYQFESPYHMSYDKFLAHFPDFQVTSYEAGFQQMIDSFRRKEKAVPADTTGIS
jgi:nucleoside-diphosphate-sugar epimerase